MYVEKSKKHPRPMDERPLISVLMTAYNRERYIAEAIESVLSSTYDNFELIIVDDCSSDKTVAIARSYEKRDKRVKVYENEKNLGDYPNRNQAAAYAKGKYLKYLDSDDLIYKHGLEVFVRFMESDQEVAIGISYKKNITHQPFPLIMEPSVAVRYHFFTEGFLDCAPTGTIIRRDCFLKLGGFSGKRMVGDLEFGLKAAIHYKVMLVPPALFFWRNHGEQEVFIGIDNNMYAMLSKTVLNEQFRDIPDSVLTTSERHKILKDLNKADKLALFKRKLKKILKAGK